MTTTSTSIDPTAVRQAAGNVPDPEMPAVTLAMLGVLHDVRVDDGDVTVELLPTFVGCPATDMMAIDVRHAVGRLAGVTSVTVRFRYEPAWTPDRITDDGRQALAEFGIAPPVTAGRRTLPVLAAPGEAPEPPRTCPYCGADDTERDGMFGPTPCRDIRYCRACDQPFEAFRS